MKDYPSDKEEYWQLVDHYWGDLKEIIDNFLSSELVEQALQFKNTRNPKIDKIFQDTWWAAPDQRWIHSIPGWNVICNLCSESYVLYDDLEPAAEDINVSNLEF